MRRPHIGTETLLCFLSNR